ncbi:MAG: hypothetical protein UR98_C0001G0086 [Parcubacteria group bacterium GW2011_GWA1_36_12]|nr:MAG: hypothetical protein UR98_C0001G0086 [Parcubacteria group bacterium GW2011_GWA1_36_12]
MKKYVIFLILISLVALWPFFKKGFFETHDGEWMVIRFSAFHQTLTGGQFPVRFVDRLNNNYGYPVLNFLYPLPFYLSEIPKILGIGFVDSVKITFIASSVFSALAMFWALSQLFTKNASLAGAMVYLFIPYRFVDLYVRGSLGENVAFAVAPIVLGSIFKISKGQVIFLPLLAICVGLLITSHNVVAALFLPLLFLISMLLIKKGKQKILSAFFSGLLISAFFWISALYDLQFVKLSEIKVSEITDHVSYINKLIIPSWGYGATPQGQEYFSPQVGIVALAIFIASVYLFLKSKKKDNVVAALLIVFIATFLLMSKASLPIWKNMPLIDVIQFPWRLLSVMVLISGLLAAFVVDSIKNNRLITILIIVASITSTIIYTKPKNFVDREDGFYATNEATTTVRDEYLPLWVKESPNKRAGQKIELTNNGELSNLKIRPTNYQATITTQEGSEILVNTIFFPGYKVQVDGQSVPTNFQNKFGLITFQLPKGIHEVIITYGKTPVHLASEIVSLLALIGTGVWFYTLWRKQNS